MRDKGIEFEMKDVTADPANIEELLQYTNGVTGTPVIVIGNEVIRGFDRGKLSRTLGL